MRTVAGTLKDPSGTALSGVNIVFTPMSFFQSSGLILPQPETVTTDGSGNYSVSLGTDMTYRCQIGSGSFDFDLEAGASTSLDELI